jgi:uncharacterized protein YacL
VADWTVARAAVVVLLTIAGWFLNRENPPLGAGLGLAAGTAVLLVESRFRKAPLESILGVAAGGLAGLLAAWLLSPASGDNAALRFALFAGFGYLGAAVGAAKAGALNLGALGGVFSSGKAGVPGLPVKILDTSVIIDGRIVEVCEAGFLDGPLVIPQFVLRELQLVADSSETIRRNRGRRGLDVLQRLQKMNKLEIQITEQDFPIVKEVDLKLIELAKLVGGKIVTNDFNLNKVAQVRGVDVLNINELANALRPVVLPGETMRVFILKEGKEQNQGVAYLDDGTMVVVDNARRLISKTIDVTVTSVLQTTAGKMIFGKHDDRLHSVHETKPGTERPVREGQAAPGLVPPAG